MNTMAEQELLEIYLSMSQLFGVGLGWGVRHIRPTDLLLELLCFHPLATHRISLKHGMTTVSNNVKTNIG